MEMVAADQLNQLRNGDYVRLEGGAVSLERFDVENFM